MGVATIAPTSSAAAAGSSSFDVEGPDGSPALLHGEVAVNTLSTDSWADLSGTH